MPFIAKPVQDFIGSGLTFPIQLQNGRGVIESGYNLIRSSIRNILAFEIGRKFFLGEFGSRLNELLEEPDDEPLHNMLNIFIVDAITTWEKRITSISTSIEDVSREQGVIQIRLVYKILNAQNADNFIYPFYTQITH